MSAKNKNILLLVFVGGLTALLLKKGFKPGDNRLTTKEHLNSLHPKFKFMFMLFIKRANDLGYKEKFESSYRSFKQQAQEHKADSRNSKAGFSSHNYGAGADITFIKDGKVLSKNTPQQNWIDSGLVDIAKKVGLDWGGNFKGYKDNNHFYVRGLNTSKLYSEALRQFKTTNPDKIQGNRVNIV